jgi:hypothetical protein
LSGEWRRWHRASVRTRVHDCVWEYQVADCSPQRAQQELFPGIEIAVVYRAGNG